MWSLSLFLKVFYCILPTLLVMRWDDKMLTYWDEVWTSQALWHSIKIILAWWYLEGSSALRDLGSSSHGHVDGWRMSGVDDVDGCGSLVGLRRKVRDFIIQLRMAFNLKLMKCLFLAFSTECFWTMFVYGSWNHGKQNCR